MNFLVTQGRFYTILQFGNNWWERSSNPNNSNNFVNCNTNGYPSNNNNANNSYGVAPGFSSIQDLVSALRAESITKEKENLP